jgi:CRP-like cAMP-binding protein
MHIADQPIFTLGNRLLMALPPDDIARLWPRLEAVKLPSHWVLHAAGEPITTVYFPQSGYASMLASMEDGDAVEVGLVGYEGMIGLPVLFGADHDYLGATVQSAGTALRMDAQWLREELEHMPVLRSLLLRYTLVHHGQVARVAACNECHHTDQRLARWLLMAHDRASGNAFPMNRGFLGMMLGVARVFQKAGFVQYERGCIKVTDRPDLESVSCECYGVVRHAYDQLLGPSKKAKGIYHYLGRNE